MPGIPAHRISQQAAADSESNFFLHAEFPLKLVYRKAALVQKSSNKTVFKYPMIRS